MAEALGRFGRQRLRSLPPDPKWLLRRARSTAFAWRHASVNGLRLTPCKCSADSGECFMRERPERRTGSRRGPKLDGVGPRAIFGAISKDPDSCPPALVTARHDHVVASYNLLAAEGRLSPRVLRLATYSIPTARDSKAPRHRRFDARLSALHHRDHRTIPLGQSFLTVLDVLKLAGRSPWTHPGLRQHWLEM